jgi:hypothetical protein
MSWRARVAGGMGLIALAVVLSFVAYRYWPRTAPAGQPALLTLASLAPLREAFNAPGSDSKLLVLLSPTCPKCIAGAARLGTMVPESLGRETRVLVVWMPVLVSDVAPPTSSKLALLPGASVRQFWDPEQLVSRELLALGRAHLERWSAEEQEQITGASVAWDVLVMFPGGSRWEAQLPLPSLWGFPVEDNLERIAASHGTGAVSR